MLQRSSVSPAGNTGSFAITRGDINLQTFLPYSNFRQSAECLDNRRLGKQRIEAMQILKALIDSSYGWQNHPAVRMWRGYEYSLVRYGLTICHFWMDRGFKDTCEGKIYDISLKLRERENLVTSNPPWLGREDFHLSHRSNLLRKYPEHYRIHFPDVPDNLPYVWPV